MLPISAVENPDLLLILPFLSDTPNLKTLESSSLLSCRKGAVKRGEPSCGKSGVKIWYLTGEGKVYAAFFGKEKL
jgi:CRISPR-associated protein Csa3